MEVVLGVKKRRSVREDEERRLEMAGGQHADLPGT